MRFFTSLLLLLTSCVAFAGEKDVNVINEPTVNIGNAPDVNVANDVSSPIPVTIENGILAPIPVVNADTETVFAREPFFLRVEEPFSGQFIDYVVPSDRILVIEAVNVEAYSVACSPGDLGARQITRIRPEGIDYVNGPEINLIIVPLVQTSTCGTSGTLTMSASLNTRMYAMPNDELLVDNATGASQSVITFTGYLVPSNSPSLAP